ncbi:MAG TPA: glycosyltransferase family 2 protein [Methylomirabilota bacterium]|jgi:glycosyltransferase involved in cell wall biosynthesis|nr:glycosyltransferase family 2 protein [Methylomirabilota bacterium]
MTPKVTAVIPVYNREKYVGEAIDSVLAQTFTDFELLVIDDGSTDRSRKVVQSYRDSRIRLVVNDANQGIPRTRNKGVQLAQGEYLAFLDSDDWAYPERFAKQVAFLDRHPEYAAVGTWAVWMDEEGRSLRRVQRKPVFPDEIAALRLFRQGITNSTSMARTAVLREFEHREKYDLSEDFDLWVRIAAKHKLAALPEVLVRCRRHKRRISLEQAHRAKDLRLTIYAAQLRTLGMAFTDTDLERHLLLRSMRKQGFTPDLAYLEWADAWLQRLRAANQQTACYPEPAFSELLGRVWLKVCWRALRNQGWTVWRRFLQSPLRGCAWPGVRRRLFLYTPFFWRMQV